MEDWKQKAEDTRAAVEQALRDYGITFTVRHVARRDRSPSDGKPWDCDEWSVRIQDYTTSYYTGAGHRLRNGHAPAPRAADVLSCLLSDSAAIDQSFVDWAADLGYDPDSRKALATYDACCATGTAIRKIFPRAVRDQLAELLADF